MITIDNDFRNRARGSRIQGIRSVYRLMTHRASVIASLGLTVALLTLRLPAATIRDNVATPGFQLLELPVNGRLIAMGSAGTAMPGWGFSYYNPAMPFLSKRPYAIAEYGILPALDLHRGHFETAWPIGKFFLAGSMTTSSILNIYPATIQGVNYNAPGSAQLTMISLAGGYSFMPNAALAINVNGIQDRIMIDAAYLLTVSLGAVWQPINDKLTIGLAALHFAGSSTSYLDTTENLGHGAQWPVTVRGGVSWRDRLKSVDYSAALDLVYRGVDGLIMVPAGLEVWPVHALALRVGKRFNHDTELMNFGVGLRLEPLTVDVAFVLPRYVDDVRPHYTVSLCYSLREKAAAKKSAPAATSTTFEPVLVPMPDTVRAPATAIDTTEHVLSSPTDSSITPLVPHTTVADTASAGMPVDSSAVPPDSAASIASDSAATSQQAAPPDTGAAIPAPGSSGSLPAIKQP
jgi:hypothetical protein